MWKILKNLLGKNTTQEAIPYDVEDLSMTYIKEKALIFKTKQEAYKVINSAYFIGFYFQPVKDKKGWIAVNNEKVYIYDPGGWSSFTDLFEGQGLRDYKLVNDVKKAAFFKTQQEVFEVITDNFYSDFQAASYNDLWVATNNEGAYLAEMED